MTFPKQYESAVWWYFRNSENQLINGRRRMIQIYSLMILRKKKQLISQMVKMIYSFPKR